MTLSSQVIAVIGAGNIGRALIGGLVRGNHIQPHQVRATRRLASAVQRLQRDFPGIHCGTDSVAAVREASLVVLAVKPMNAAEVLTEIAPHVRPDTLIVTVVAGLTTETILKALGNLIAVVRAMPNTPMLVDKGATAIARGTQAKAAHMNVVRRMFEAVGKVEEVPETLMDAVTGLSGSGPAYVFMLIEALTDAGVKQGLMRSVAFRLSTQTVLGAATLVAQTGKHPAILRDEVTTPGGTAIAAIAELESHGLRTMIINAVATATQRSKELSRA